MGCEETGLVAIIAVKLGKGMMKTGKEDGMQVFRPGLRWAAG